MQRILLLLVMIALAACSTATVPAPTQTAEKVNTATSTPEPTATHTVEPTATATATETPLPTDTPTPSSTPTATPLPAALKEDIFQIYKILMFVQLDANLLSETASRVKAGELGGFESFGVILGTAAIIQALDELIAETTVPDFLEAQWDDAMAIHKQTKDILRRWVDKEIDSTIVVEEIEAPLAEIDTLLGDIDQELANSYGFDPDELQQVRNDAVESISEIFGTPTPSP